jgi:hypothetical protein
VEAELRAGEVADHRPDVAAVLRRGPVGVDVDLLDVRSLQSLSAQLPECGQQCVVAGAGTPGLDPQPVEVPLPAQPLGESVQVDPPPTEGLREAAGALECLRGSRHTPDCQRGGTEPRRRREPGMQALHLPARPGELGGPTRLRRCEAQCPHRLLAVEAVQVGGRGGGPQWAHDARDVETAVLRHLR